MPKSMKPCSLMPGSLIPVSLKRGFTAASFLGAAMLTSMPAQAEISEAQAFVCENSGETREVAVEFEPGNLLPCSVNYTKGGEKKTLWRATHEANYCGVRAQELIAKLERSGWQCALTSADVAAGEPVHDPNAAVSVSVEAIDEASESAEADAVTVHGQAAQTSEALPAQTAAAQKQ